MDNVDYPCLGYWGRAAPSPLRQSGMLEDAAKGYAAFDSGAATTYVLNPYLQGYLAVDELWLYVNNRKTSSVAARLC
jgi:hypothetical protein